MDIRTLNTFVRAVELGSFTKAAEELNYVQSTVTMQIQQLEKELGYPLFDRIGNKLSVTVPGMEFLHYAYEILHTVKKAEMLGKRAEDIHGVLRLGVSESILIGTLMELLPAFKTRYPHLDLRIKTGHTTELLEQLKQNQLDMLYLSANRNTDPDFSCHHLHKEHLVFISGPEHPLAARQNISFSELMQYPFLVTEREGICHGRLKELSAQYQTGINTSIEIDNIAVITELVARGMGIAFLPEYAIQKHIAERRLLKLDVVIPEQIYYSQVLCHKSKWMSPFMTGLLEQIKSARALQED